MKDVVCSVAMKYVEVQPLLIEGGQMIPIINNWYMVRVRPSSNGST